MGDDDIKSGTRVDRLAPNPLPTVNMKAMFDSFSARIDGNGARWYGPRWLGVIALVMLAACAQPKTELRGTSPVAAPESPPPSPAIVMETNNPVPFPEWLSAVRREAEGRGFKPSTLAALDGLQPIPKVIELDRRQPEAKATLADYLASRVTRARVARAKALLAEHRALLDKVSARYGVQPRFILAFWAIETDFGRATGGFQVIPSLATLAYDGRRAEYFRGELFKALQIVDSGAISPKEMRGSWAGAMGQTQFMPSSYLKFAVDFNGQGRADIWHDLPDVFGSIAHYLAESGWRKGQGWGREVSLPAGFKTELASLEIAKSVDAWRALGLTNPDGSKLPKSTTMGYVILPPRANDRAFMVYDNFKAIRAYNPSHFYAIAIGQLADAIGQ